MVHFGAEAVEHINNRARFNGPRGPVASLPPLHCLTPDIETNRHDETDETAMSRPAKNPLFTEPDQAGAIRVWGKLWGIGPIVQKISS